MRDQTIDREIGIKVVKKFDEDREKHTPSGKLSASILGNPLQWQILKVIGVTSEMDEYVKRKLQRGKDVEDWIMQHIPDLVEKQKGVEYKNTVGYVDAIVDHKNYDTKIGVIPHEIKSVANAKFRRIVGRNGCGQGADHSHILQVCLYAMALKCRNAVIDYVASDDYRVMSFVVDVRDYTREVDDIINKFHSTIEKGIIPEFKAIEKWQELPQYSPYYDWQTLTPEQSLEKLKKEFPESYDKLLSYKKG